MFKYIKKLNDKISTYPISTASYALIIVPFFYGVIYKYFYGVGLVFFVNVLFIAWLIIFILAEIHNYKKASEEEAIEDSKNCLDCISKRMDEIFSFFKYYKLSSFKDLTTIESKLLPESEVVVYTDDLATEDVAQEVVRDNISKGVKYTVLYFRNTNKERYSDFKRLYNLVDLSEKFKTSSDGELAKPLGIDIIVFKQKIDNADQYRGFFAVDLASDFKCQNNKCPDYTTCNHVNDEKPFYKEMDSAYSKKLFTKGFELFTQELEKKQKLTEEQELEKKQKLTEEQELEKKQKLTEEQELEKKQKLTEEQELEKKQKTT